MANKEITTITTKTLSTESTPSQIKDTLKYIIQQNVELANAGKSPVAFNIEGPPGCSKTSICKQVAEEFDHYFVRLNVAEIDSCDITGYPLIEYEVCKNDECLWIPSKLINDFILQGYNANGEHRMSFSKPEWIQGKEDKPILLLFDDYSRGVNMVMQACMRITDEQEYVSWKLPKGSTVILTTNPDNEDFFVTSLDSAQKS